MIDKETNPTPLAHILGRHIRILRIGRGWSQEALAKTAGVHRNYLGQVERGTMNVSLIQLAKIAKAVGMGAEVLLEYVDI